MPTATQSGASRSDAPARAPSDSKTMNDVLNREAFLQPSDTFIHRHIGPRPHEIPHMLAVVGANSLDELTAQTVPADIRLRDPLRLGAPRGEYELLRELREIASLNQVWRSFIGMGYYGTITPPVIQRNVLENPGWYTQYTPYQAEIAQGRLEALLNFQTLVSDLTGLPVANASLLDEATAAAEAMHMCQASASERQRRFFVAQTCHPQTIAVVKTRALPLNIEVVVGDPLTASFADGSCFGILLQDPDTIGSLHDYAAVVKRAHDAGAKVAVATDLLALTLIRPPGEWGADIALGNSQRFGVPLGFGGPHAAFIACTDELKRQLPGRLVGVSRDAHGNPAYRLSIQTREQHIRRDKATSNICTAQVLLAIMAGLYAVYHGPEGLTRIARRVRGLSSLLGRELIRIGHRLTTGHFFDTLQVHPHGDSKSILSEARKRQINLRQFEDGALGISLDESTTLADVCDLIAVFNKGQAPGGELSQSIAADDLTVDQRLARRSGFLKHAVFNSHHSEHEMLRYMYWLQQRDLSLATSMIPLGSCTMKLNGTSEMLPVTWPEFGGLHPFAPPEQWRGYARLITDLQTWLAQITGLPAVSLQPNAGAQGEYTGLLVLRAYHESKSRSSAAANRRNVCLIPVSAHGTNPASAVMAGFEVIPVTCDAHGNIDVADLRAKAATHADRLGALMITYPSTHGVFEDAVREMCAIVHQHGGQVYMDGANMNAQVGLTSPGEIGADVCHLNLHKTFCIPHGGGGPGMGPIAVAEHLAPFLPGHPIQTLWAADLSPHAIGPVSAAPFGSASILPISWVYIALMGAEGLTRATQVAILNANYMAARLRQHYSVLYTGRTGRVAHEFILDLREFRQTAGIEPEDVAKRLIDYGFHAPTMSWPVPGTLMIEPTESEPKEELDRFCDTMIAIREEIRLIEKGRWPRDDNPLKYAPHTAAAVAATAWTHPYSREQAAFPLKFLMTNKFWSSVGRIDNVWGDRNLFCTCPPEG